MTFAQRLVEIRRRASGAFDAGVASAFCLLSACVPIGTPRAEEPVTIQSGEASVFGRIRMLNAEHEGIEYSAF